MAVMMNKIKKKKNLAKDRDMGTEVMGEVSAIWYI